jgi:pimeloyl-ACP methyl ester carboxylesterase
MLSWPDALCEALARGGRHVVRYDLRDSGASSTVDPEAPAYTLRDLAADAAALARELDDRPAHLAGIGVGGMVAQVAALDHPEAFSALTLAGTRPVAPGPADDDLPDHDAATMGRLFSRSMPDWSDRAAVTEYAAAGAQILGNDPAAARAAAARIWDRTPGTEPAVQMANQLGLVFARLDCTPRWRERLAELAMPALVVHGRRDPFFPVGNGETLAREIPGARLLVLERASTAIPDAAADLVATAMLGLLPEAPGPRRNTRAHCRPKWPIGAERGANRKARRRAFRWAGSRERLRRTPTAPLPGRQRLSDRSELVWEG